jgi:acetoacetate decarboxylase
MYLDDNAPIAGGREIWGFPKKLASPKVSHEGDVVVCTLHYGSVLCVSATMGFKHREIDPVPLLKALARPNFMLNIIPISTARKGSASWCATTWKTSR